MAQNAVISGIKALLAKQKRPIYPVLRAGSWPIYMHGHALLSARGLKATGLIGHEKGEVFPTYST